MSPSCKSQSSAMTLPCAFWSCSMSILRSGPPVWKISPEM